MHARTHTLSFTIQPQKLLVNLLIAEVMGEALLSRKATPQHLGGKKWNEEGLTWKKKIWCFRQSGQVDNLASAIFYLLV